MINLPLSVPLPLDIPSPPRGVWEVGPIPVRAYALFIIVGIIVAGFWGNRRLIARGGRPGAMIDMGLWMVPFGLIGGRIYHLITDPELYFYGRPGTSPWDAFAIWNGGLGIWGAIALGAVGAYIASRRYRIPFGAIADALAPGIVLAQAIGRLGNYFNQELFGSPTTLPWALQVYLRTPGGVAGSAADCGTGEFPTEWIKASPEVLCGTYHPTFLYELVWDVLIALLVVWADRRFRLGHGRAFALYVAGYCAGRGWIEMLRIDHANHILGLRVNVFVAAAVFLAAVIYLVATRGLRREDPATVYGIVPRRGGAAAAGAGEDDAGARGGSATGDADRAGDDVTAGAAGDQAPEGGEPPDGDRGDGPPEGDEEAGGDAGVQAGGVGAATAGEDPSAGDDPRAGEPRAGEQDAQESAGDRITP